MKKGYKIVIIILIITSLQFDVFPAELHNDTNIKVVLIGFDGLEWFIIEDLIKEGKMPTFARLIRDGTYGNLQIFDKSYPSSVLWTSLATGKRPEIHGILDFAVHEDDKYELTSVRSYHRKVKALWNILSECGKKAGIINYFATWQPEEINGFIVSDKYPQLSRLKGADVFPSNLINEINSITESYRYNNNDNFFEEKARGIIVNIDELSDVTSYLYQKFNKDLDLLITYTRETDTAQHLFWKFMEPEFFQHPAWGLSPELVDKYGNFIPDIYQRVDGMVKEIISYADKDTIIIICSDHGFQSVNPTPQVRLGNLNNLLEAIGFLAFENNSEIQVIDFFKTKAYHYKICPGPSASPFILISINLKRREPQGIIQPGEEYLQVKKRLIDILSNLRIVETGKKLFNMVTEVSFERGDIGISIKNNIDLLEQHVKINEDIYPLNTFYTLLDSSGGHRNHKGVFIIYGKNIKKAKLIEDVHILDITPTILYLLGIPIAKDMEGKILTQAIEENFLKRNPVKYIDTYEDVEKRGLEKSTSDPIDKEQLEKLKSLGYVH